MRIETHPLRAARRALLLLGETGEKGEIAASLSGNTLIAELTLNEDASYRFWLQPPFGRAVREARSHHLTVEADAAPRVDILGPADRLELATPRPIEIGYSATDDYGVGTVELVYRAGDRPEQRVAAARRRRRAHGAGTHAVGSGVGGPGQRASGSPTASRRAIATTCRPSRRAASASRARRARCT